MQSITSAVVNNCQYALDLFACCDDKAMHSRSSRLVEFESILLTMLRVSVRTVKKKFFFREPRQPACLKIYSIFL